LTGPGDGSPADGRRLDPDIHPDPVVPPEPPGEPAVPAVPVGPARPGVGTFTIEGRAAPGLFVVGWLATISGLALILIGAFAPSGVLLYLVGPAVLTVGLVAGAGSQTFERRARGEAYAGPSPYLVFAAIIPATFFVFYVVGFVLRLVLGDADPSAELQALVGEVLQAGVFIGILSLTVVGTGALSWREMGWRPFDLDAVRNLALGLSFALPVIFVTGIVAEVLVSAFGVQPESPLPPTGTAVGLVLELLAGALIAPLIEEALFRGFAITAWQRTVGNWGAIVRASLLFALAHVINVSGTSDQILGLVVIGFVTRLPVAFVLGWLFVRQRSIWAPIGLHMSFNGILLVIAALNVASGGATG
jgi:membrane protease YdiL (CAAX protease family)